MSRATFNFDPARHAAEFAAHGYVDVRALETWEKKVAALGEHLLSVEGHES
jgi:hypothetical protein